MNRIKFSFSLTPGVVASGPNGYRVHSKVASVAVSSNTTVKNKRKSNYGCIINLRRIEH